MKCKLLALILAATAIPVCAQTEQTSASTPVETTDSLDIYSDLDEFVFTAKKEVVKSDGAKLTYDLEQDDSSKGQTLLDALKKVPMVTVDGQDNIKIKGSSDFKIYVNGKEDPMLTANYQKVFKMMPAESVMKIEVITEPGAKYDAEGTGGILNLVTEKKQTREGYSGSVHAGYSSQQTLLGGYGRVKYRNVTADLNINWANNSQQKQHSTQYREVTDHASDENYRQVSDGDQKVTFDYLGASLNLSWEPDDRNLFTVGSDINLIDADIKHFQSLTSMFTRSGDLKWQFGQHTTGWLKNLGLNASASYRHNFDDKGQNLIVSYFYNFGKTPLHTMMENENILNYPYISPWQSIENDNYQRSHTTTVDYTLPLSDDKHLIEAGVKGVFRRNTADSGTLYGDTPESLTPDMDNLVHTDQIQDVYAVYGSYTGKFGNVSAKAGLRYEHTHMGMDFMTGNESDFRRNLDDVVPNAAVTYMFGPATNLRAAYQMRIRRPGLQELNPYRMSLTDLDVQMGNPNLESEKYHNLSLTYSNYGGTFGGNIGVEYMQANNSIEEYTYFEDQVQYTTYGNLGKYRRVGLNGYLNWNINMNMSLGVGANLSFVDRRSGVTSLKNHGWSKGVNANWTYSGPWAIRYGLYGGWDGGQVELQGKNGGFYYYGLSLRKSFLKEDALSVTLTASNFLNKYHGYKSWTYTDDRTVYNRWSMRSWNVGVQISWNFGHLKERVKSTGASAGENDNASETAGSKNGGSGGIGL